MDLINIEHHTLMKFSELPAKKDEPFEGYMYSRLSMCPGYTFPNRHQHNSTASTCKISTQLCSNCQKKSHVQQIAHMSWFYLSSINTNPTLQQAPQNISTQLYSNCQKKSPATTKKRKQANIHSTA